MSDLIPFVQQEEEKRVKEEIKGRKVSVVFDGASRLGEAMAIILRFVESSSFKNSFSFKNSSFNEWRGNCS